MSCFEVRELTFFSPLFESFICLFPALQQRFIRDIQQDITEVRGAVRKCQANHLHWVVTGYTDPFFSQCHTRILAQRHTVINVIPLLTFEPGTRHQCLANTIRDEVTVARMNMRLGGFIGRRGRFTEFCQQQIFRLID